MISRDKPIREDELYHWKYAFKKKVNGKWRYYYDVGPTADGSKGSTQGYTKLEALLGKDERDRMKRAADRANDHKQRYETAKNYIDELEAKEGVKIDRTAQNNQKKLYENNTKAYLEYKKAYMKTPLGKIDQASKSINKAKKAVSKYLSKSFKKKKQKKQFVTTKQATKTTRDLSYLKKR